MSSSDPLLGQLVAGRYRIQEVLGAGGMATVYGAVHEELGRGLAVKVVSGALANRPAVIERFLREARTVAQLGHPNIVDVYDLGRLPDERPFLVMERLDGESFSQRLQAKGRLSLEEVVWLLGQVADALELVHGKGIIHRDIKLENLMACRREDGREVVKVLDFGIAAVLDPTRGAAIPTSHGSVTGTPLYMAPEAIFDQVFDQRADVYSLAVVAYFLLSGQAPYTAPDLHALMRKKLLEPPPTLRSLGVPTTPELEGALARGLARESKDRYGSARALVAALAVCAPAGPPTPVPVAPAPREERRGDEPTHPPLLEHAPTTAGGGEPPGPRPMVWLRVGGVVAGLLAAALWWAVTRAPPERWSIGPALPTTPAGTSTSIPTLAKRGGVEPADVPTPPNLAARGALASQAELAEPLPRGGAAPSRPKADDRSGASWTPPTRTERAERGRAPPTLIEVAPETKGTTVDRALAEAATAKGTQALLKGRLPEAIESFREALNAAPQFLPAWRGLGLANERMGRKAEAIDAFRYYLRHAPRGAEADSVRARLERLEGQTP